MIDELFVYEALLRFLFLALSLTLSSAPADGGPLLPALALLLELLRSAAVATGGGIGCVAL